MQSYLGLPVVPLSTLLLGILFLPTAVPGRIQDITAHLVLIHERLQSIQSLLQGDKLSFLQRRTVDQVLEFGIVERAATLLLLEAHLAQDSLHHVEVQGHASLDGAHGHEVVHALRVQIFLVDSEFLDRHVRKVFVDSLRTAVSKRSLARTRQYSL